MTSQPKSEGPAKGTLLIVGGIVTPVTASIATELGGMRWVIIPTAKGPGNYEGYQEGGLNLQKPTVLHAPDRATADAEEFVAPLKEATAVWFSGGRQFRLVDIYKGTKTETELRAVLERGGLIGGTSAGATIQGSYLLRGAPSEDNRILSYTGYEEAFAYISNTAIDQHVTERRREYDLACVVARYPNLLGIGIDERAAVLVQQNIMAVIDNRVLITDGAFHNGRPFYALQTNDRFDLATWTKTT
jgi:cyanophycinase